MNLKPITNQLIVSCPICRAVFPELDGHECGTEPETEDQP